MRDKSTSPGCAVVARASLHTTAARIEPLRSVPAILGRPIAATFLRHSDEQTVAAVAALNSLEGELSGIDFHDWAVFASSRHIGRAAVSANLARYRVEGAWAASPHIVPHRCLHSPSGTLSLALKSEGPNFGVGEPDATLALAISWLAEGRIPGALVAITWIDPEFSPDPESSSAHPDSVVHALVLALMPDLAEAPLRLSMRADIQRPPRDLAELDAWLLGRMVGGWPLANGLTLERAEARPRVLPRPRIHSSRTQEVTA